MKTSKTFLTLIILLFTLVTLQSCKKDDLSDPTPYKWKRELIIDKTNNNYHNNNWNSDYLNIQNIHLVIDPNVSIMILKTEYLTLTLAQKKEQMEDILKNTNRICSYRFTRL